MPVSRKNKKIDYANMIGKKSKLSSVWEEPVFESATYSDCESDCENCRKLASVVQNLAKEVSELKTALQSLQNQKTASEVSAEVFNSDISFQKWKTEIEERIESRTNRQLRQTLVFRGIPEEETEKIGMELSLFSPAKLPMQLKVLTNRKR